MSINARVRAFLIGEVRNSRHKGCARVVAQVWNATDQHVHHYCEVRSKVRNAVIESINCLK